MKMILNALIDELRFHRIHHFLSQYHYLQQLNIYAGSLEISKVGLVLCN
jgi:hypothetical protein